MAFREIKNEEKNGDYPPVWDITGLKKELAGSSDTVGSFVAHRTFMRKNDKGEDVENNVYELNIKGTNYSVFGTGHLDYLMKKAQPQLGDTLRIVYEGMEKVEGKMYRVKKFRLWVDTSTRGTEKETAKEVTKSENEEDFSDIPF